MTTQNETWQKACVIAGLWAPNQRCVPSVTNPCDRDDHWPEAHFIECPPVGDPAATVKMLEFCFRERYRLVFDPDFDELYLYEKTTEPEQSVHGERVTQVKQKGIANALAVAIVAIGEKP